MAAVAGIEASSKTALVLSHIQGSHKARARGKYPSVEAGKQQKLTDGFGVEAELEAGSRRRLLKETEKLEATWRRSTLGRVVHQYPGCLRIQAAQRQTSREVCSVDTSLGGCGGRGGGWRSRSRSRQHCAAVLLEKQHHNITALPSVLCGCLRGNVKPYITYLYLTWNLHGGQFRNGHSAKAGVFVARRDSASNASFSPWGGCRFITIHARRTYLYGSSKAHLRFLVAPDPPLLRALCLCWYFETRAIATHALQPRITLQSSI